VRHSGNVEGSMPKPVHNGYFIPIPKGIEFDIAAGTPQGIYLHHNVRTAFIDYAGLGGKQPRSFKMPGNTNFLRELAEAIELLANDIDRLRGLP
jgi:hypothetical protein